MEWSKISVRQEHINKTLMNSMSNNRSLRATLKILPGPMLHSMRLKPVVELQQSQPHNRLQLLILPWMQLISNITNSSYLKDMINKQQQHMLNNTLQHTYSNKDNSIIKCHYR